MKLNNKNGGEKISTITFNISNMSQPIRKSVIEKKPELENKPFYSLLIDGNNMLKRCFADTKVNTEGIHYGAIFQVLLQIRMMLQKKAFDYVYIFFDGHKSGLERFKLYSGYKANREDKDYASILRNEDLSDYGKAFDEKIRKMQDYFFNKNKPKKEKSEVQKFIDENFSRERDILLKYFNELYIRWVFDNEEETEVDDYIAYYVLNKKPEERIVIMSSDHDLTQLLSEYVCIYDHMAKKFITKDNLPSLRDVIVENVVIEKIFCGDVSDNIKNIEGVSTKRLHELMPEIKEKPITIEEVKERAQKCIDDRIKEKKNPLKWHENIVNGTTKGNYDGDFYEINKRIIDLKNPMISKSAKEEMDNMMYNVQDPEGRSFGNLFKYIVEDDITELRIENKFAVFFEPFKSLAEKEINRYKKEVENGKV